MKASVATVMMAVTAQYQSLPRTVMWASADAPLALLPLTLSAWLPFAMAAV